MSPSHPAIFVTGTDTNVGKTFVSALLCAALKAYGLRPLYFKPVQTGMDEDTVTVQTWAQLETHEIQKPVYHFPEPISPNRAAALHGVEISLSDISQKYFSLRSRDTTPTTVSLPTRYRVIEGAGGLLVPLNPRETIRDLARALETPLLIVASTRLGTINHTLLTVETARTAGIRIAGIVLNGEKDSDLAAQIATLSGVEVLAEVPHWSLPNTAKSSPSDRHEFSELAQSVFPLGVIQKIFSTTLLKGPTA